MVNSGLRHSVSPGLALGEKDAAAQILAGHVEKRVGRLDDRHVDGLGAARGEELQDVGGDGGVAGGHGRAPPA